jgi:hypothetical protein
MTGPSFEFYGLDYSESDLAADERRRLTFAAGAARMGYPCRSTRSDTGATIRNIWRRSSNDSDGERA